VTNLIYPKWKAARSKAQTPDLSSAGTNVKIVLVDLGQYTYAAGHEFLTDIPSGARIATSGNLANKVVNAGTGVLDADDFTLPTVSGVSTSPSTPAACWSHRGTAWPTGHAGRPASCRGR
jgi:hypothetical protein